jgi:hypothetical protein
MEIKVYFKDNKPIDADAIYCRSIKRVELHGEDEDYRVIESNVNSIEIYQDGSIMFWDELSGDVKSIFFYPDELDFVVDILNIAIKQRDSQIS